jgi:tetratricopeptide (TPR) repeat protein
MENIMNLIDAAITISRDTEQTEDEWELECQIYDNAIAHFDEALAAKDTAEIRFDAAIKARRQLSMQRYNEAMQRYNEAMNKVDAEWGKANVKG